MNQKELKQYEKLVLTPVEQLIPTLAVPTVISMMVTMIYNLVDAFSVGKLGTSASGGRRRRRTDCCPLPFLQPWFSALS